MADIVLNFRTENAIDETVAEDGNTRRPWHKPTVTRINISRTLAGGGSATDAPIGTVM